MKFRTLVEKYIPHTGFRVPNFYTLDAVYYLIFSILTSYLLTCLIWFLTKGSIVTVLAMSSVFSLCFFILLLAINNERFKKTTSNLQILIASSKDVGIDVLYKFYYDIKAKIEVSGIVFQGVATADSIHSSNIQQLLIEIFGIERAATQYQKFVEVNANCLVFLNALQPLDKEVLYRYYLAK